MVVGPAGVAVVLGTEGGGADSVMLVASLCTRCSEFGLLNGVVKFLVTGLELYFHGSSWQLACSIDLERGKKEVRSGFGRTSYRWCLASLHC